MALPEITSNPVRFGKVIWTGLVSKADTLSDPDDIPDEAGLEGVILFKPSSSVVVFPLAVPPYTRALVNREVDVVDAQIDEQGRKYVKLEANVADANPAVLTWSATFVLTYEGVPVAIPTVSFGLMPDETIDLTDYINPGGASVWPGFTVTQVQQILEDWAAENGGGGGGGGTGAPGKSAYQVAVDNGFVGTVTAWLASLKGAKGDPGDPGAPGEPGSVAEITDGSIVKAKLATAVQASLDKADSAAQSVQNVIPVMEINTAGGVPIVDKENWITTTFYLNGKAIPGAMRGRGNSTWDKPKQPWNIKLDNSVGLLGMPTSKRWSLLANYGDPSAIHNAVAFEIGRRLTGLDWTPRSKFVRVVLNGVDQGLYQLTEPVRLEANRVNYTAASGTTGLPLTGTYLLEADFHFDAENKFSTTHDGLPMMMDDPDGTDVTTGSLQFNYIRNWINNFETVLYDDGQWLDPDLGYARFIDRDSFIDYYLAAELCANIDAGLPGSMKLYKTRDTADTPGKLYLGPMWDYDLALGEIWATYSPEGWWVRGTVQPTTGATQKGMSWVARMCEDPSFLAALVARWTVVVDLLADLPDWIVKTAQSVAVPRADDYVLWVNGARPYVVWRTRTQYLLDWLEDRIAWITANINPVVDTTAPSIPTGLASSLITTSSFTVSWSASTDDIAVTGYQVRLDGGTPVDKSGTSHSFAGLTPDTDYSVDVRARDAAGNWSSWSTALPVPTLEGAPVVSGYASVFGDGDPDPTDLIGYGTDGGGILWCSQNFYVKADSAKNYNIVGAKMWLPTSLPSAFYSETIRLGLSRMDWQGVGLSAISDDWITNGSAVTVDVPGPHTPGAWIEVEFPGGPYSLAKVNASSGALDVAVIGIRYANGNNYLHVPGGTFLQAHGVDASSADNAYEGETPGLIWAETDMPRAGNRFTWAVNTFYGLDILVEEAVDVPAPFVDIPFNEGSGSTAANAASSGSTYNFTAANPSTAWDGTAAKGQFQGWCGEGSPSNWTAAFEVVINSFPSSSVRGFASLVGDSSTRPDLWFEYDSTGKPFIWIGGLGGGSSYTLTSSTSMVTGVLQKVVYVLNGSTAKVYLNGVEVASSSPHPAPFFTGAQPKLWEASELPDGKLDRFRWWNSALTPEQVAAL